MSTELGDSRCGLEEAGPGGGSLDTSRKRQALRGAGRGVQPPPARVSESQGEPRVCVRPPRFCQAMETRLGGDGAPISVPGGGSFEFFAGCFRIAVR